MNIELSEEEMAALVLLKRTGVPALEAAQVACAAIKLGKGRTKRALRCIAAGAEELKKQERTVSFEKAVAAALEARRERRVPILSSQEIKNLRQTSESYKDGSCAAAVGMMLYAGIRPHEVGLTCPPLAAGCAAAYLCELPPEPFSLLRRAAAGDGAPGIAPCYARAMYAPCKCPKREIFGNEQWTMVGWGISCAG